jgi:hypothetical protein
MASIDEVAGVPSAKYLDNLPGGASRLAALLLPQILRVFSVVAPCQGSATRQRVGGPSRASRSGILSNYSHSGH